MGFDIQNDTADMWMWWCRDMHKNVAVLNCLTCKHYPCEQFTPTIEKALADSPFTEIAEGSRLRPRRVKMYLFLKYDDTVEIPYDGFDVNDPDWEKMSDVKEVWFVGKVYEKQMKLVTKPKGERGKIRESLSKDKPSVAAPAPAPKKRKRKAK